MPDPEYQELLMLREENKRLHTLVEELLKTNTELKTLLADLQAKLDVLIVQTKKRNRRDYGKKTERYNPRPALVEDQKDTIEKPPRQQDKARLAKIDKLDTKNVPHAVPEDKRFCPNCHVEKVWIGDEVTYQLERIVNTIKQLKHVQEVLACPKCKGQVVVAPKPEPPFPKSQAAPGLLSHLIVSKYADCSPLYRIEKIYAREGAPIPRSTLCDWIMAASLTLKPLYDLLKTRIFQSKVVSTDDTDVKIQDRKIAQNIRKGKMTAYLGDVNNPYNIFDFSANQSFDRNKAMFKGFKGFVQADAAPGFNDIFEDGNRIEVGCNAHARRKFFECLSVAQEKAEEVLKIYRDIYEVEKEAQENNLPPNELLALRQAKSKPLLKALIPSCLKCRLRHCHNLPCPRQ